MDERRRANAYSPDPDAVPMARKVVRLGLSMEPALLEALDRWVRERNSGSRSDAVRSLIRKELAEEALTDGDADAVGCLMLLYRHDVPNILQRVTAAEHRWGEHIRSSSHVHLEGGSCMQILGLAGKRRELEAAAEDLRGIRGVAFGRLALGAPTIVGGASGHQHPHAHRIRLPQHGGAARR
jgi:CopG family nickel-responsive transcriptional regulator